MNNFKITSISLVGENDKIELYREVEKPINTIKTTSSHIVAYIDLLGTTEKIRSDINNKFLNIIYSAVNYVIHLNEKDTGSTFIKEYQNKIKTKIFSDNILIAIPIESQNEELDIITAMMKIVALVQTYLLMKCDWLSRGAITKGDLFIDDNFVWGKALVNSYTLESKLAIFPRVIIDSKIMKYYSMPGQESALSFLKTTGLSEDKDGLFFVSLTSSVGDKTKVIEKIEKLYYQIINNEKDDRVVQKYNWLSKTYLTK